SVVHSSPSCGQGWVLMVVILDSQSVTRSYTALATTYPVKNPTNTMCRLTARIMSNNTTLLFDRPSHRVTFWSSATPRRYPVPTATLEGDRGEGGYERRRLAPQGHPRVHPARSSPPKSGQPADRLKNESR